MRSFIHWKDFGKPSSKKVFLSNSVRYLILQEDQNIIPYYMNAADILLLTSLWEGSPNVIKEAMACNCPIVSTDVGDVKEVIGKTNGCYICSYDPGDVAEKIKKALDFGERTNGRKKIKHLDQKIIAEKIIEVYKNVLRKPTNVFTLFK